MLVQHIFISYADDDGKQYRDELITKLKEAGFKDDDYWYDKRDIELGEEWRTEIDKALDEAFIVIIVLTPGAVRSHAVTYEWAKAISDSLKVIPVWFKLLEEEFKHPLIERKQWANWSDDANKVIDIIKKHSDIPPDVLELNKIIVNKVALFRVITRLALWFYPFSQVGLVEKAWVNELLEMSLKEAYELYNQHLPEFMVDKAFAFTSKQKRKCRHLINTVKNYFDIFYPPRTYGNPNYRDILLPRPIEKAEQYRVENFDDTMKNFDTSPQSSADYKRLDHYLKEISKGLSKDGGIIYQADNIDEMLKSQQFNTFLKWIIPDEEKVLAILDTIEQIKQAKTAGF